MADRESYFYENGAAAAPAAAAPAAAAPAAAAAAPAARAPLGAHDRLQRFDDSIISDAEMERILMETSATHDRIRFSPPNYCEQTQQDISPEVEPVTKEFQKKHIELLMKRTNILKMVATEYLIEEDMEWTKDDLNEVITPLIALLENQMDERGGLTPRGQFFYGSLNELKDGKLIKPTIVGVPIDIHNVETYDTVKLSTKPFKKNMQIAGIIIGSVGIINDYLRAKRGVRGGMKHKKHFLKHKRSKLAKYYIKASL